MSSKNAPRKKEALSEPAFDLEQQFILRLPPGPSMALRRDVQAGSLTMKDKFSIEVQPDHRHCVVRYGNELLYGKLMDLPCIIESHKTVDMKTFYKTADISQILICSYTDEETSQDENESPKKKEKDKNKKYHYPHGVTPPLKNVRKRRFRKTLKKKYMEQPDIEKEVKRLFRTDAEAINVKWEIIVEEDKPTADSNGQGQTTMEGWVGGQSGQWNQNSGGLDYGNLFGDLSSSDEDEEEEDEDEEEEEEKDINIMDSGEEDLSRGAYMQGVSTFTGKDDSMSQDTMAGGDPDSVELQSKLSELKRQVEEIRQRRKSTEDRLAKTDSPVLQQRIQAILDQTIEEEEEKGQES
ncbi:transcription initiation factor TFIID subunit 7-like isoform X2 [Mizuhopecten yessoensis]|uniref:transcription initiation factor TFIID subunit 7-like isoform X2 n=1 Tax=Mizuhopecten yessoensis TaxID=6573 RepID=UPI000B45C466|nr:transcription initiation factor TFIID subunit 7-like isoform X2 [Mizuhopecten yessoensis]